MDNRATRTRLYKFTGSFPKNKPITAKFVKVITHATHKRCTGVKGWASGNVTIEIQECSSSNLSLNVCTKETMF